MLLPHLARLLLSNIDANCEKFEHVCEGADWPTVLPQGYKNFKSVRVGADWP